MSYPSPSTQVVATGLGRLTSAHRNKPVIRAYLTAFLTEVQEAETAIYALLTGLMLGSATVYALPLTNNVFDMIGKLVGLPRNGLGDADYKALLYLQVAVNRSGGRTADWSTIAGILLRTSSGPAWYQEGKAKLALFIGGMTLNPNAVAGILAEADANGIGPNTFAYSRATSTPCLLWGNANHPTDISGGILGDAQPGSTIVGTPTAAALNV